MEHSKTNWQSVIFVLTLTVAILFAANSVAIAQNAAYKVGDRVEVYSDEYKQWYKAEIVEVKDGSYFVDYDGFGSSVNNWVKPERMRPLAAPPGTTPDNPMNGEAAGADKNAAYRVGDKVDVYSNEYKSWYKAEVIEVKNGAYFVDYDNFGSSVNNWVAAGLMRLVAAAPTKTDTPPANEQNTLPTENETTAEPKKENAQPDKPKRKTVLTGATLTEEIIKEIIEGKEKTVNERFKPTVTFESVRIGKTRKANLADEYDGIPKGETVYPVRVKYSITLQYSTGPATENHHYNWDFFKDSFGEWKSLGKGPVR